MISIFVWGSNLLTEGAVFASVTGLAAALIFLLIDSAFCWFSKVSPLKHKDVQFDIACVAVLLAVVLVGVMAFIAVATICLVYGTMTAVFIGGTIWASTSSRDNKVTLRGFWQSAKDYYNEVITKKHEPTE